jgi:flavodoxin
MNRKLVKGIVSVITAGLILTGCGSSSTADTSASEAETAAAAGTSAAGSGKVLVAYFSATGNTEAVAEIIADTLDADTFEIVPVDPYTDDDLDYNDEDSRVSQEHNDESLQDIALETTTPDNWDSYDTVFIGYPIWWGSYAWPVTHFVTDNDFTGKTVIPFCTSASSGIGNSASDLASLTDTGSWQEGQRFRSSPSESDVADWAEEAVQ